MHHQDVFGMTLASLFFKCCIELWPLCNKGEANFNKDVSEELQKRK
jgi:hypothetical protein